MGRLRQAAVSSGRQNGIIKETLYGAGMAVTRRFLRGKWFFRGLPGLFGLTACFLLGAAAPGTKMPGTPQPLSARAAHYERVMAEFEAGNFSAFYFEEGDYPRRDTLERSWQTAVEWEARGQRPFGNTFARVDLNGDGRDELVWSDTSEAGEGVHPIKGIFRYEKGWMKEVVWDDVYMVWFYFLGPNGSIVHHSHYYGTYDMDSYDHIAFDRDLNYTADYGLSIWCIYSMDELLHNWADVYPDMNAVGFYFRKEWYTWREGQLRPDTVSQLLAADEFRQEFRELTGLEVAGVSEVWEMYLRGGF